MRKLPTLSRLLFQHSSLKLEITKDKEYSLRIKDFSTTRPGDDEKDIVHTFANLGELNELISEEAAGKNTLLTLLKKFFPLLDDTVNFISSFRLHPERTYYETTKRNLKVGKFGEDYINQIIL
ncbi:MAG: hypothetical protein GY765_02065 [bacterium]|nr:hypothetical protein [bacterium]